MKTDYHIHTEYSWDSSLKAADLIAKAISLNYSAIAITEHLDLLPAEMLECGVPAFAKYLRDLRSLAEPAAGKGLRVIAGIEVGDYQRVHSYAAAVLERLRPDLVLGAVHFLADGTNVAIPLRQALSSAQVQDYYRQNLKLVRCCKIDVLAHLGVYKRYYQNVPDETRYLGILRDIFQAMIERGIALELNFSGLRKPYGRVLPEPDQLELYRALGGELITFGSDAHRLDHFDDHLADLPAALGQAPFRLPL